MEFTHEEIIQIEVALTKQVEQLKEAHNLVAEEGKAAAQHILKVNMNALEKARALNSKYQKQYEHI